MPPPKSSQPVWEDTLDRQQGKLTDPETWNDITMCLGSSPWFGMTDG